MLPTVGSASVTVASLLVALTTCSHGKFYDYLPVALQSLVLNVKEAVESIRDGRTPSFVHINDPAFLADLKKGLGRFCLYHEAASSSAAA